MNKPRATVMGPAACNGCGMPVFWAYGQTRESWNGPVVRGLLAWREATGRVHRCGPLGRVRI